MVHNDPCVVAGFGAYGMKRKGKVPVGKCRDAKPLPEAEIRGVHGRSLSRNGNAGLFTEANQISHNPGQPDRRYDDSENKVIFHPFKNIVLFTAS